MTLAGAWCFTNTSFLFAGCLIFSFNGILVLFLSALNISVKSGQSHFLSEISDETEIKKKKGTV